jgi:hypothetical protein
MVEEAAALEEAGVAAEVEAAKVLATTAAEMAAEAKVRATTDRHHHPTTDLPPRKLQWEVQVPREELLLPAQLPVHR